MVLNATEEGYQKLNSKTCSRKVGSGVLESGCSVYNGEYFEIICIEGCEYHVIPHPPFSAAGPWLFAERRWLDATDPGDNEILKQVRPGIPSQDRAQSTA